MHNSLMTAIVLVDKINKELLEPIRAERQVAYLLVQIRRLIELTNRDYRRLKFHCDWVLHVELDRNQAQKVVERFDSREWEWLNVITAPANESVSVSTLEEFQDTLLFATFRQQLLALCAEFGINSAAFADDMEWDYFLKYYGYLIEECPLCHPRGLPAVRSVFIKVVERPPQLAAVEREDCVTLNWCWISEIDGSQNAMQTSLRFPWPSSRS